MRRSFRNRQNNEIIIETRCTERVSWTSSAVLGIIVLCMQMPPIFIHDWVHVIEPRAINRTNEKGEFVEIPFYYNIGYFRACRYGNLSDETFLRIQKDFPPRCIWNSIFTGEDLGDFSFASNAILVRLGPSTLLHIVGSAFTVLAFLLSVNGHIKRNTRTLCSAIIYFIGGLSVMAAVLQLICVVDDEMYPRMRSTPSGEPSYFYFNYGITFLVAALSFLPIQICIYLQTSSFFNRFPEPYQKAAIVPGLNKLLQQVSLMPTRTHQLGKCSIMSCSNNNNNDNTPKNDNNMLLNKSASFNNYLIGGNIVPSISATSSLSGCGSISRQRRDSRTASRDFTGLTSPWSVHQEIRNPDILTAYAIRRPSSQLYLI